jgi:hypothetical protein
MPLYSYKGQEPEELPFRIRLDDGSTRTSLNELSIEDLESFGFVGPIIKPKYDELTQKIEWNGGAYEIIDLTEEEIVRIYGEKEAEENKKKLELMDYNLFWELLIGSGVYKKLRAAAAQSLVANTICTELIALFSDAKVGRVNKLSIQKYMDILVLNFEFTAEEVEELQKIMDKTNLSLDYTLSDAEYISSHIYDFESNTIAPLSPFASWVFVNGEWNAPIPYPTDGKVYDWNEDLGNWTEI